MDPDRGPRRRVRPRGDASSSRPCRPTAARNVRAATNDGGAWLIKRDQGLVGHVNRAVGEVSGVVRGGDPRRRVRRRAGRRARRRQRSVDVVALGDRRAHVPDRQLPRGARRRPPRAGRRARRSCGPSSPLAVWRLTPAQLTELSSIDGLDPQRRRRRPRAGHRHRRTARSWPLDVDGGRPCRAPVADGAPAIERPARRHRRQGDQRVSAVGERALSAHRRRRRARSPPTVPRARRSPLPGGSDGAVLAQPAPAGSPVVVADGRRHGRRRRPRTTADRGGGDRRDRRRPTRRADRPRRLRVRRRRRAADVHPDLRRRRRPDHRARRARRARRCACGSSTGGSGSTTSTPARCGSRAPRASSTGSTTGAPTSSDADGDERRLGEPTTATREQRENPDADDAVFTRADELDEDGINEPPVARDDQVRTRVDQPVVVDVLANDEDPDGDVLLVTSRRAASPPTRSSPRRPTAPRCRSPRRPGSPAASRSTTRSPTVAAARPRRR